LVEPQQDELQLAQRILELTKILGENTEKMNLLNKEFHELKTQQQIWIKTLEEWDINLDKRFREIDNKFSAYEEKITENLNSIQEELKATKENTDIQITETVTDLNEKLETKIKSMREEFESKLSEKELKLKENIEESSKNLQKEVTSFQEQTSEELGLISETLEMLVKNVKSINILTENHTETLEEHRNSLTLTKQKINEIVEQTKKNQEQLFENFSRILESYNEDIRTEIAITAQSLQESDTELLKQSREEFMSKKFGNELKNTIIDLSAELRAETQKTRDDLLKGLQDNVDEYKKVINEQNINIKRFQDELGEFKNEIHAIIDRKVNEKYELVYKLLAKVSSISEELSLLIKVSEIIVPPQAKHLSNIVSQDESIQNIVSEKTLPEEKDNISE